MRTSPQSRGLVLNMGDPSLDASKNAAQAGTACRQPESSLVLPFPYAGMNQVRFEGCALRPRAPAQPPLTTRPLEAGTGTMRRTGTGCKRIPGVGAWDA